MTDTLKLAKEALDLQMDGKAAEASEKFHDMMAIKVSALLDDIKPAIAADIFNGGSDEQ